MRRGWLAGCTLWLVCGSVGLVAAQESEAGSSAGGDVPVPVEAPAPPQGSPACPLGELCRAGRCVSACRRPCEADGVDADCADPSEGWVLRPSSVLRRYLEDRERQRAEEVYSAHRHDGFFFLLGGQLGVGLQLSGSDSAAAPMGYPVVLMIGGTIGEHLVLAFQELFWLNASEEPWMVGLMGMSARHYPDPTQGLYFGGGVGLGFTSRSWDSPSERGNAAGAGPGATLEVGYDFWIGDQWSMELSVRVAGIQVSHLRFSDHSFGVLVPSLAAAFVLH